MRSHPAKSRRVPRQVRGERRVAALIDAAESVIGEYGYEATTMSEIAVRAGACIGSLYQFFPNKESITHALSSDYCARLKERWEELQEGADSLSLNQLISSLIDSMVEFIEESPAFLPLLDAPAAARNRSMRPVFRDLIARLLRKKTKATPAKLMRVSVVVQRIIRAMNELYAEAAAQDRKPIVKEFKLVLECYVSQTLRD
jgi:AcrR family transcriptional regulator